MLLGGGNCGVIVPIVASQDLDFSMVLVVLIVFFSSLFFGSMVLGVFGNQMPSTRNQDTIVDGGTVVSNTSTIQ